MKDEERQALLDPVLAYIRHHITGQTRMPLLVEGAPGSGRYYAIREALVNTVDSPITQTRIREARVPDITVITGADPIADVRDALNVYRQRENPAELPHTHIIIRALDKASGPITDSLLKLTEEPPKNTIITMTATDANDIAPAIASRTIHVKFPPHTETSLRHVLNTRSDLRVVLPVLGRQIPPISTNDARYRYWHNLDHLADLVAKGVATPTYIRDEVNRIYQADKENAQPIALCIIRLTERSIAREMARNSGLTNNLLRIHTVTEETVTKYIAKGNVSFASSMPNGLILVLLAYLGYALTTKQK